METPETGNSKPVRRALLLAGGWCCILLGILGALLPLLPTTPFLLAAAACFAGSSPRMRDRLLRCSFLRHYFENYRSGSGVPVRTKCVSLAFLWITLGISALLKDNMTYRGILLLVGIAVSTHILMLRGRKRVPPEKGEG